jgi:hypothetical protein
LGTVHASDGTGSTDLNRSCAPPATVGPLAFLNADRRPGRARGLRRHRRGDRPATGASGWIDVHWFVAAIGPADGIDAFTGGANFFPALGDSFQTLSATRSFVVR